MKKYLQHFPKPLLDDLVAGRWLPIVGAGMSLNAKIDPPAKMPLWPDLGAALSSELRDYSSASTLDAIQHTSTNMDTPPYPFMPSPTFAHSSMTNGRDALSKSETVTIAAIEPITNRA